MEKLSVSVIKYCLLYTEKQLYTAFINVKKLVLLIANIFPPALYSRVFSLNLFSVSHFQGSFGLLCLFSSHS